jgi:predicted Zn-dependent protease
MQRAAVLRAEDEVAWYRLAQANRMLGDPQAQKQALASFQKLHAQSTAARNKPPLMQSQESVTPQTLGSSSQ